MSDTKIEWTDQVSNPTTGCDRVSRGCDNCYAMKMAKRLKGMGQAKYQRDGDPRTSGTGFGVTEHPDVLSKMLRRRKDARVFLNSMSDIFHADISDEFIARAWATMALTPHVTYQVLTKRHARMRALLSSPLFSSQVADAAYRMAWGEDDSIHPYAVRHAFVAYRQFPAVTPGAKVARRLPWPLPNVWLGVSAEDQAWADIRVPALLQTPAAVRWVSAEPLLGPIDLHGPIVGGWRPKLNYWLPPGRPYFPPGEPGSMLSGPLTHKPSLDWLVVGGESGPGARPMDIGWAEVLVAQCQEAGVPVLVKQLGSVAGGKGHQDVTTFPPDLQVREYPRGSQGDAR